MVCLLANIYLNNQLLNVLKVLSIHVCHQQAYPFFCSATLKIYYAIWQGFLKNIIQET